MILRELYNYYERMSAGDDSPMPKLYWSRERVGWEFEIDREGNLLSVLPSIPAGSGAGKNKSFTEMFVPEHDLRSSGIKPFFLCDKASYFLGLDDKRGNELLASACDLHEKVLSDCEDDGAQAVISFFRKEHLSDMKTEEVEALKTGSFIVFFLEDEGYIHDRPAIKQAWRRYREQALGGEIGQCLVTGEQQPLARLFPQISGFPGAQSAGASLVSFNKESFEAYGKEQGQNAPVAEKVAFGSSMALGYLLKDPAHHCRIGDSVVVFWSDQYAPREEMFIKEAIDPEIPHGVPSPEDEQLVKEIKASLTQMSRGKKPEGFDANVRFFVLGLAPNAARLSVRFFETSSFGDLEKNLGAYFEDTALGKYPVRGLRSYLNQTAPRGASSKVPSSLVCSATRAMLTGSPFPWGLYSALLLRMRTDRGTINQWDMPIRASMFKAFLVRQARFTTNTKKQALGRSLTMGLNECNTHTGYLLGRLFALLEKAQRDAQPNINKTIRDRYMASASTTPARVFPLLMRLSNYHISKAEYGGYIDSLIRKLCVLMDDENPFPKTLSYEEQGLFYVAYQQQKDDLYEPKDKNAEPVNELVAE
ncbi:MAG: type I-C CRISPR-associated protein Cas8c/Csd1 [Raoultibacter sp.]